MPLRLSVGVSKKLGLPAYSSVGASCQLEVELETDLLRDPAGFRDRVRDAFDVTERAVDNELARLRAREGGPGDAIAGDVHPDDLPPNQSPPAGRPRAHPARAGRPATANQVRAILSIARRRRADLDGLLCDRGVARPEELSLADASSLIDRLKAAEEPETSRPMPDRPRIPTPARGDAPCQD